MRFRQKNLPARRERTTSAVNRVDDFDERGAEPAIMQDGEPAEPQFISASVAEPIISERLETVGVGASFNCEDLDVPAYLRKRGELQ